MAAQTDVKLVVQVVDQATAEIKKIAESFRGFEGAGASIISLNQGLALASKGLDLLKTAITAPVNQFRGLFSICSDLVKKYDETYLAQTRLSVALGEGGNASGKQSKVLIDLANSLAEVTRFDDDAIVSAEALAAQLGVTADQMPKFIKGALDLSAGIGIDLTSAVQKMAGAMQSGTFNITRGASVALSASTSFGRLNEIIAELGNRNILGQAEAQAKGGAAGLIQLDKAIDQLEKALGGVIAASPAFTAFINTSIALLAQLKDFVSQNSEAVSEAFGNIFVASLLVAESAVEAFIKIIEAAGGAINALFASLDSLSDILDFAGISTPFTQLKKEVNEAKAALDSLQNGRNPATSAGGSGFGQGGLLFGTKDEIEAAKKKVDELQQKLNDLRADPSGVKSIVEHLRQALAAGEGLKKTLQSGVPLANSDALLARFHAELKKAEDAAAQAGKQSGAEFSRGLSSGLGSGGFDALEDQIQNIRDRIAVMFKQGAADIPGFKSHLLEIGRLFEEIQDKASEPLGLRRLSGMFSEQLAGQGFQSIFGEETFNKIKQAMEAADPAAEKLKNAMNAAADSGATLQQVTAASEESIKSAAAAAEHLKNAMASVPQTNATVGSESASPSTPGSPTAGGDGSSALATIAASLQQLSNQAGSALSAAANSMDSAAGSVASAAFGITDSAAAIGEASTGILSASDAMSTAAGGMVTAGSSLSSIVGPLQSMASVMITAGSLLIQAANKINSSQKLAVGGVVTQQTFATIGERAAEVVLPLDDRGAAFARSVFGGGRRGGGSGDSINVSIHVDRLEMSDRDRDRIAQEFSRKLADQLLETARRG